MASISNCAARFSMRSHRRDSSTHSSFRHRPRLLRSTATQPSITASNAIRGPPASSNSHQSATDLLSRVAIHSPPLGFDHSTGSGVTSHQVEDMVICHEPRAQSPTDSRSIMLEGTPSGYYFSFPSFDEWDGNNKHHEKDSDD